MAALKTLYLESGSYENCKISCEELRSISAEIIRSQPADSLKLQCTKAIFQIEQVLLTLEKYDPHSFVSLQSAEVASIFAELIQAASYSDESRRELCFMLCDFLARFIQDDLRTPQALLDAVQNFDSETLVATFAKLEDNFRHVELIELLEQLIHAKCSEDEVAKNPSIIPLLLEKAKLLRKCGKLKEIDKIYMQIIALEKLMVNDSDTVTEGESVSSSVLQQGLSHKDRESGNRVFKTQTDFLHSVIARNDFDLAFDLAFEMITKSTNIFESEQASVLFETIDTFVLQHKYSNAIELMIAIFSRTRTLNFSPKMITTFDVVFLCCLQQNEFAKAQLLLNRAKNLTRAQNEKESPLNFIQAAANRYTNAFADKEVFRFAKLNAALADLRKKNIYCHDIELFTAIVRRLVENDITYPDHDTSHSPPD